MGEDQGGSGTEGEEEETGGHDGWRKKERKKEGKKERKEKSRERRSSAEPEKKLEAFFLCEYFKKLFLIFSIFSKITFVDTQKQ